MAETSLARDLDGLRRSCGLSYRELARRTGCPRSTLNDALRGRRFPRLSTVLAIVRACASDTSPDETQWRQRWVAAERARSCGAGGFEAGEPARRTPAELPHAAAGFVGRAAELDRLDALLDATPADPAALLVVSIDGAAGVGKTALAVRWGQRVAHRFPGGQLFVNLRGHHPRLRPLRPGQALEQLLRALGVTRVPAGPDERSRAFRSALAGRRVLVVLDDAATAGQVRPLLPGDPSCAVVVTSRERLDGLTALDGARRIDLNVLCGAEARDVLARALSEQRIEREPAAAAELAALCANLPLALRIAAAHLAAHADRPIGALVAELAAAHLVEEHPTAATRFTTCCAATRGSCAARTATTARSRARLFG